MDSAREAVKERGKGAVCISLIAFSGSTLRQGARGETLGLGGPRWSKAREEMGEVSLGRRSAQWEGSFPPSHPPVGGAHHSQNPYFTDQGLKGQKVEVKELTLHGNKPTQAVEGQSRDLTQIHGIPTL